MEKIIKVDFPGKSASIIIRGIPLYAIEHLSSMAEDITGEIMNLCFLEKKGTYFKRSTIGKSCRKIDD